MEKGGLRYLQNVLGRPTTFSAKWDSYFSLPGRVERLISETGTPIFAFGAPDDYKDPDGVGVPKSLFLLAGKPILQRE